MRAGKVRPFCKAAAQTVRPETPSHTDRMRTERFAFPFAAAFLAGYLPGILLGRSGALSIGAQVAAWYMDKQSFAVFGKTFSAFASGTILQLTFVLLCGLNVAGTPFLALHFLLCGGALGFCAASVMAYAGTKALVIYWLLTLLPDLASLFLSLWLSGHSAILAEGLFRDVFGGGAARGALCAAARRLLIRYGAAALFGAAASAAGAGLACLLGGVLL